ncbi:MAG: hypothetical protein RRC07_08100 [Anaerolineae bacterium]|nr:hypothetical protein [Anaerolineae bacterium]
MEDELTKWAGVAGAIWGVGGVLLLVAVAMVKLAAPATEALSSPLRWFHWLAILLSVATLLYGKGYRGFYRTLAPLVGTRAAHLRAQPTAVRVLLAPLYCMGYFHSERRQQVVVVAMTAAMVGLIFLMRSLAQPWRGIVDTGIIAALAMGCGSIVLWSTPALVPGWRRASGRRQAPEPPL